MERIRLFVGKIRIARIAEIAVIAVIACNTLSSLAPVISTGAPRRFCLLKKSLARSGEIARRYPPPCSFREFSPHCQSQHGQAHGSFVSPTPFASVISTGAPRRFCLFKKSLARSGEIPRRYPPPCSFREFSPHCQSQHAWVLPIPAITRDYAAIPAIPAIPPAPLSPI